jgi:hypothetical protein
MLQNWGKRSCTGRGRYRHCWRTCWRAAGRSLGCRVSRQLIADSQGSEDVDKVLIVLKRVTVNERHGVMDYDRFEDKGRRFGGEEIFVH